MTVLVIMLVISLVLLTWSALSVCSLDTFRAELSVLSQLTGADAHARLVEALLALPGVRLVERNDREALVSVLPTVWSMSRGFGIFLLVRDTERGVLLQARSRLPFPTSNIGATVRQVEREARMSTRSG
ncbi:MAG TPA: hypothetical protein VGJ45_25880 [Pseudonocardiaceae bacterium]